MYKVGGNNLILFCGNFVFPSFVRELDEKERDVRRKDEIKKEHRYFTSLAAIFWEETDWKLVKEQIGDDLKHLEDNSRTKKSDR